MDQKEGNGIDNGKGKVAQKTNSAENDDDENKRIRDEAYIKFLKELDESERIGTTSIHQESCNPVETETTYPGETTAQTTQDTGDTMDANWKKLIDTLTNGGQGIPTELVLTLDNAIMAMRDPGDVQIDIRVRRTTAGEQETVFEQPVRRKQSQYTILQPRHRKMIARSGF